MMPQPERHVLSVLVVDGSAVVREGMQKILAGHDSFAIITAESPQDAARKMEASRPDVILLDPSVSRREGLAFLRRVMADDPIPVVIFSVLTHEAAELALQALVEGAVDIVTKPHFRVDGFLEESAAMLADTLRAAAAATLPRRSGIRFPAKPLRPKLPSGTPRGRGAHDSPTVDTVIAVGASTGGTEALSVFLGALPPDAPGVLVVQHMPAVFTGTFARRLDASCAVSVREAKDRDRVLRGHALIAPGNRHMILRREGDHLIVRVVDGPTISRHRPSVDVLFRSVADAAGRSAVGVLLTGMGRDGADGLRAMKEGGARTLAQDEATCVAFGMPKEAIALGAVDEVVPLARIAPMILDRAAARET
jgi:two-component system chemotaxis response regulator CheB